MRLAYALLLAGLLNGMAKPPMRLLWAQVSVLPPGTTGVQQNRIVVPGVGLPGVPGSGGPMGPAPGVPGSSIQNVGAPGGNAGAALPMAPSPLKVTGTAVQPGGCNATLSRSRVDVPSEGGVIEVALTSKPANCAGLPPFSEAWLEQQAALENGLYSFRIQENSLRSARAATVGVAGQMLTVVQAAAPGYHIAVSPGRLDFVLTQGKTRTQKFAIWSDHPGLIFSTAVSAPGQTFRVTPAPPKKGKNYFKVVADATGLPAKRIEGTIRVTAPGAEAVSIPVVLSVFPK